MKKNKKYYVEYVNPTEVRKYGLYWMLLSYKTKLGKGTTIDEIPIIVECLDLRKYVVEVVCQDGTHLFVKRKELFEKKESSL